jgi:hypothetical protein
MVSEKDLNDVKLARPIAVVNLWDIDDRISQLEEISRRLEKTLIAFCELYREERVKSWELILKEMVGRERGKKWTKKL